MGCNTPLSWVSHTVCHLFTSLSDQVRTSEASCCEWVLCLLNYWRSSQENNLDWNNSVSLEKEEKSAFYHVAPFLKMWRLLAGHVDYLEWKTGRLPIVFH